MIQAHFRVLDMGNVLPGQNCEVPPPYLISFQLTEPAATARIDYFTRTVRLAVPPGTGLKHVAPRFTVFRQGTRVLVDGAEQVNGRTVQDCSSPVVYRLVAPDGTANTWTVVVTGGH